MGDPRNIALICLRFALTPVIKFCLRRALTIQDITAISKSLLVEIATKDIERLGSRPSTSKLSVITGIRRKEIDRIKEDKEPGSSSPMSLLNKVIGQWLQSSEFTTKARTPRILDCQGEDSGFYRLVRMISTDVKPGTVLEELKRIGAVEQSARGIRLVVEAFNPKGDPEEGFRLLALDTDDLIRAVEENVYDQPEPLNLHAVTEYDNIPHSKLPEIRSWFITEGMSFHRRAREFLSRFDKDVNTRVRAKGKTRVMIGSFSRVDTDYEAE